MIRVRDRGFTMIEVLAVLLVTSLLLGATITFYIDLSRQAARATENTREVRRAAALVDRIAEDLQHTMLVKKPEEADVLGQPWLFVAESRYSQTGAQPGSDQLKFIRTEIPRSSDGPASIYERVAYTLDRSAEGDRYVLRRWSAPDLGEGLDREFPREDDPASLVVADDLNYFALRFMDGSGEWVPRWDSTLIAESSQLPFAVEIEVGLAPPLEVAAADPDAAERETQHYARQVELPLRPIDLEELLHPKEKDKDGKDEDKDEDDEQRTVGECVDVSKISVVPGISESLAAELSALARNNPSMKWTKAMTEQFAPFAGVAIKEECL